MAIHGDELIRIENLQFLTDEIGEEPLYPLVSVSQHLGFVEKPLELKKEGFLPMWAVQSTRVFDVVNMAAMTGAEQSTNQVSITEVGGSLSRSIRDTAHWLSEHASPEAGRDFLRSFKVMDENFAKWWADLAKYRAEINAEALKWASITLTVATAIVALPAPVAFLMGAAFLPIAMEDLQNQFLQIEQDIIRLMEGTGKTILPHPTPPQPTPPLPTPPPPSPPPAEVKKPPKAGSGMGDILLIAIGGTVIAGGAYYLATKLKGNQICCDPGERICNGYNAGLGKWVCCPENKPYIGTDGKCYPLAGAPGGVTVWGCRPGRCVDAQ
jgi:hypothetical protein